MLPTKENPNVALIQAKGVRRRTKSASFCWSLFTLKIGIYHCMDEQITGNLGRCHFLSFQYWKSLGNCKKVLSFGEDMKMKRKRR